MLRCSSFPLAVLTVSQVPVPCTPRVRALGSPFVMFSLPLAPGHPFMLLTLERAGLWATDRSRHGFCVHGTPGTV
jgi:hypothetical protein